MRLVSDRLFEKIERNPLIRERLNNGGANVEKEPEPEKEAKVEPYDPVHGDPATVTTAELPYPPMYVTVNVDELSDLVSFLEGMKPSQLKSEVVKWYFKTQSLQQWADYVRHQYAMARQKGLREVNIPIPPMREDEDAKVMKELMKVMSPIMALKTILGGESGEGGQGGNIKEVVEAVKTLKEMSESKPKIVRVRDEELGELEVPLEVALLLKNKEKSQGDLIVVENPDGTKKYVPRDIYIMELMMSQKKEEQKVERPPQESNESKLVAQLLKTVESLANTQSAIIHEINELKRKIGSGGLKESLREVLELKSLFDQLFERKEVDKEELVEVEKLKTLRAILESKKSEDEDEEERKKKEENYDAIMQLARQKAEKFLKELEKQEESSESEERRIAEKEEGGENQNG